MQQLVRRVKLVKVGQSKDRAKDLGVRFPSALALAIQNAGYTHADVFLTDDGILLKPIVDPVEGVNLGALSIPNWQ